MGVEGSPYRDTTNLVKRRVRELARRRAAVDARMARVDRRVTERWRQRIARLRAATDPDEDTPFCLDSAEQAMTSLERELDEVLRLTEDLHRTMLPLVANRTQLLMWLGRGALASLVILAVVVHMGLGDFMLTALGFSAHRAHAIIPSERIAHEARMASGAPTPEGAQWVDP